MKMQFKPFSERYYQAEKENMLYRISAMRTEPDGQTTAVIEDIKNRSYIAYGLRLNGHKLSWAYKGLCENKDQALETLFKTEEQKVVMKKNRNIKHQRGR